MLSWRADASGFCLRVPGIAAYEVTRTHGIVCSPAPGGDPALVSSVLRGMPLAAYFVLNGFLVLEASAVAARNGSVLLVGPPCSGKSSLALALSRAGLDFVADGVTPIEVRHDGTVWVQPVTGPVELSLDVLDILGLPADSVSRMRAGVSRFSVRGLAFRTEPVPLRAVCLLGRKQSGPPEARAVIGKERVLSLVSHSYNRLLGEIPTTRCQLFADVTQTIRATLVHRVLLPERPLQLAAAADLVCEVCDIG